MALIKSKTLANGATGTYWKITNFQVDRNSKRATWVISLFSSADVCRTTKAPLPLAKSFSAFLTPQELLGNLIEIGYVKIKAKASQMVSRDLTGKPIDPPIPFDQDLFESEDS